MMGMTVERVAYRPLRSADASPRSYPPWARPSCWNPLRATRQARAGAPTPGAFEGLPDLKLTDNVALSGLQILMLVICVAIMVGLYLFVQRTRIARPCAPFRSITTSRA